MKLIMLAAAVAVFVPSLALGHGGGLDQYGCHAVTAKPEYHCHQGKMKGRTYKSQDTMLAAHPELKGGGDAGSDKAESKAAGEKAKKAKAEDKVKDGDKTTTDEYAKDAKRKPSASR